MDEALIDRIRTFMAALPGVEGFNLMLKYDSRVEMVGADFPIEEASVIIQEIAGTAEQRQPRVH